MPTIRSASRISGCLMSSIRSTSSICEYLSRNRARTAHAVSMYTYLSIAAAMRKPLCSW